MPIRAIVILEQAKENKVVEINYSDKIRCLLSGIDVYRWDLKEIEMALNIVREIVSQVKVVKLMCRPNAEAVNVLAEYLKGE